MQSYPWSLVTAKETDGKLITDYVTQIDTLERNLCSFKRIPDREDEINEDNFSADDPYCEIAYPTDFLKIEPSDPPKLPLHVLREQVTKPKPQPADEEEKESELKKSNRFQPNDPSVLIAALPIHEGSSWCDLSITCSDQLRLRAPFFFYDTRFDRLSQQQTDQLEQWQKDVHAKCETQRAALQYQLEQCHSYNVLLGHMRPKCWQTGLNDIGQQYAYRYKDMMKKILGHDQHDRNSSRESLIRYTIPYNLLDFEELSPLEYLTKFCVLRDTRIPYYQRIYTKYQDNRTHLISVDKLFVPLSALMSGSFQKSQVDELVTLLELDETSTGITLDEFCFICGLAERMFYTKNLRLFGEEGMAMQQGLLEISDFHMFAKKLGDVKITKKLAQFLQRLGHFK